MTYQDIIASEIYTTLVVLQKANENYIQQIDRYEFGTARETEKYILKQKEHLERLKKEYKNLRDLDEINSERM